MRHQQSGFTLIEIAIVLVIIGLLLGGVLKGQELITSARVRNIITQQDGIKAAYFGFQDRYRALPGDYPGALATANIPQVAATIGGDGDGVIELTTESTAAWTHLSQAGFLNASYNMASATEAVASTNTPTNPYNAYLQIIFDNVYGAGGVTAPPQRPNLKTGNAIPVALIGEVDRKLDDGNAYTGTFQFSAYLGNGGPAPVVATCTVAAAGVARGQWDVSQNSSNCGGASLF